MKEKVHERECRRWWWQRWRTKSNLKLVGVADPHFVVHFTVDAEAVHAHIPRIKLLLQLGYRREGRHADRIEVLWHGEDHDPLALDGVVERDEALSRVTAEIRHIVAELYA